MVEYVRLYSDEVGESHFETVDAPLPEFDFAPPAPPLHVSELVPARGFLFLRAPCGWVGDWHPSPKRQFACVLKGRVEIATSDGETRRFAPGDCLLQEDTNGKGHTSKVIGDADLLLSVTQLD